MTNRVRDAEQRGNKDAQVASVLVVGAGPTGLLLASELHRRGVACHLIDARPGPLHWDRATVVHRGRCKSSKRWESPERYWRRGVDNELSKFILEETCLGRSTCRTAGVFTDLM